MYIMADRRMRIVRQAERRMETAAIPIFARGCLAVRGCEAVRIADEEENEPAMQIIGARPGSRLAGIYMMIFKKRVLFFADTTVNIDPTAEELADIAIGTAKLVKRFTLEEPKVAMLSFSNFGSNTHASASKMARAVALTRERAPEICVDGEMQADTAVEPEISKESFPFNRVAGDANILIFPNLDTANVAYQLMARLGQAEAIGPILIGMNKPVFVLQQNSDVNDIVNMAAITAMDITLRKAKLAREKTHAE